VRYPPPPWRLVGPAVVASTLVDVQRARQFVPGDLEIVEVKPGHTAAAIVVADYQDQASFPYGELSVMSALVRYRGVRGAWISHIWVDSLPSLLGGREMWGMYKHMASFAWRGGHPNEVEVSADGRRLVSVAWERPQRLWPVPGMVRGIGSVDGDRRRFSGRGVSRFARVPVSLDVPADSPFAGLGLQHAQLKGVAGRISLSFGDIRVLSPPGVSPSPAAPGG
jgi:hypothetical protein